MDNQEILEYIKKSFELKTQGFYKPAIEMLYKALNISPDNIEILEQLAHLYNLLGETDRAIYYIEKVLEVEPNHLDALKLLQDIKKEKGEFEQSLSLSDKICEISSDASNLLKKIQILKSLNRTEDVYNFFETIQNPDEDILYEVAEAASKNKEFDKACTLLEKSREINPKNPKVLELLAKIYYKQDKKAEAKEILLGLIKKTENPEVFNYLGLIEMDNDKQEKAVEYFSKANKLDEQNPEYLFNMASAYFIAGWTDEAIHSFRKSICLAPMNPDYHYSLAYLYYQEKNYPAAMGEVQAVRDITPNHQMSNVLYSMILAKQGNLLEAKRNLDNIISQDANDSFVYYALFTINNDLLNIDEAKANIEKAIELNPNSTNYMGEYLDFLLKREEYGKAEEIATKILEQNKNFLQAHVALAQVYMEKHDYEQMYDEAQTIIDLDSNCPKGYYYNAIAVFEQGDRLFAIESLKKAISLDLNNAMLYLKMSEFYQDMNDLNAAYDWALEAAEIDERNYNYRWLCAKIARALHKQDDALRNYSHCYRFAANDTDLCKDYAEFLKSVGRNEQAKRILARK